MFTSLHNHDYTSNIRFLDSINRPEEMVKKAISLGFSGIAFTNHESLSNGITLLKLHDSIKETNPDFKIIFGNEIYLIDESEYKNTNKYYHFVLIAKDEIGYKQLKELSSGAWKRAYTEKGIMRVPTFYQDIERIIGGNPGHIIGSTACIGGFLDGAILEKDSKKVNWFVPWCIKNFGKDNFFFELQVSDSEEQITCNRSLIKMSQYFNIPYIITTDSHYLDKEDLSVQSAFLNSKQSGDRETEKFYQYTYIMSEEEMAKILTETGLTATEVQLGLDNTMLVYNAVQEFDFRHSTIVPTRPLPEFKIRHILAEYYDTYPFIKAFAYSKYEQDRYLLHLLEEGITQKNIIMDAVRLDRLNTELEVIKFISKKLKQDLSAYFIMVKKVIDLIWQVSFIGVSRGSAAGFYVNYLLDIVQIDPLEYNLPYWRFLSKDRPELPDIDIDLSGDQTANAIALMREYYGEDCVLNCATFKTESLKSAILTACRGIGVNNDEAQTLASMVPVHRGHVYTLQECEEGDEEQGLDAAPQVISKLNEYDNLLFTVKKIEGLPTNSSIHASALYIFNGSYLEHNSLMRAPNGTLMTAFTMHDSDEQGALKFDLLRTDAETKLMKCMDLLLKAGQIEWQGSLRATYNKYLHPNKLNFTNETMWKKVCTNGIPNLFQFETGVANAGLHKGQPRNVHELATINSLIRLMPPEGGEAPIDKYERFRKNPMLWDIEMLEAGLTEHEQQILKNIYPNNTEFPLSKKTLCLLYMTPKLVILLW